MPIGLISEARYARFQEKKRRIAEGMKQCEEIRFTPKSEVNDYLRAIGYEPLKEGISVRDLLKRPNITLAALAAVYRHASGREGCPADRDRDQI